MTTPRRAGAGWPRSSIQAKAATKTDEPAALDSAGVRYRRRRGDRLALIAAPSFVARLLLGAELPEIGAAIARVAGITLVALVLGSWLGRRGGAGFSGLAALLAYNALVAIYLGWLGWRAPSSAPCSGRPSSSTRS